LASYREHIYPITVGQDPILTGCEYYVTADNPVGVFLLEGHDCGGTEVECQSGSNVSVFVPRAQAGDYLLVIDNPNVFSGTVDYDITVSCY
jgi:hypothetical protein